MGEDDERSGEHALPVHSEKLVRQLAVNKVGIVQAFMANQHHVALAVLVAQLAQDEFAPIYSRSGFNGKVLL